MMFLKRIESDKKLYGHSVRVLTLNTPPPHAHPHPHFPKKSQAIQAEYK